MKQVSADIAERSAPAPRIDLRVETGDWRFPQREGVDIAGPTLLKLIVAVKHASGWVLDVFRNGRIESNHSAPRILGDEFCTVICVPVRTSCAFRIICRDEYGHAAASNIVVVRMESGLDWGSFWNEQPCSTGCTLR